MLGGSIKGYTTNSVQGSHNVKYFTVRGLVGRCWQLSWPLLASKKHVREAVGHGGKTIQTKRRVGGKGMSQRSAIPIGTVSCLALQLTVRSLV